MSKKKKPQQQEARPHFRIDWRDLSYTHRPKTWRSRLGGSRGRPADQHEHIDCAHHLESPALSDQSNKSNKTKRILNSLDGQFRSGELSAILGPSGAGKSTFLATLFGGRSLASENASGQTRLTWLFNDDGGSAERGGVGTRARRRGPLKVAFLPQQDNLLHHLSVYETLYFASRIKNVNLISEGGSDPRGVADVSDSRRGRGCWHKANVRRVARMLKLTDCLETRCGKLSGGQYKRVSIGQELLSQPDVIILDEPTSGLDASTCLSTVRTLKNIVTSSKGNPISVILTIHQPDGDVFELFDRVYVIAQGGLAIYEGPPSAVLSTLRSVGLEPPQGPNAPNAARFIVDHAFLGDSDHAHEGDDPEYDRRTDRESSAMVGKNRKKQDDTGKSRATRYEFEAINDSCSSAGSDSDDESDEESSASGAEDQDEHTTSSNDDKNGANFLTRSLVNLTGALTAGARELAGSGRSMNIGISSHKRQRASKKKLLFDVRQMNIAGFRTADGRLVAAGHAPAVAANNEEANEPPKSRGRERASAKRALIRALNEIQKRPYYPGPMATTTGEGVAIEMESPAHKSGEPAAINKGDSISESGDSSNQSDYSSAGSSSSRAERNSPERRAHQLPSVAGSNCKSTPASSHDRQVDPRTRSNIHASKATDRSEGAGLAQHGTRASSFRRRRRDFDKQLSSHANNHARAHSAAFWLHAGLLAWRTWLSIVRDPIFFGIQALMHTTIPILLALIFGHAQEEGCPQLANLDLVQFAYSDSYGEAGGAAGHIANSNDNANAISILSTVGSIRQSIANIGIIFFEMFVLCFAINCITALVFPSDMFVLLKEYRNGWYSMGSYFIGRSLADLPLPVILHSIAMLILCTLTSQPLAWWRLSAIVCLVILASLVAQSIGLTVGAILMRNSQSAVLAAAGVVAPFFALSGFIVRAHSLPLLAQYFARGSYLHHLLNGFIILRYGFGRCPCQEDSFNAPPDHPIPAQLTTMTSLWLETYANEFPAPPPNQTRDLDLVGRLTSVLRNVNSFGHQMNSCAEVRPYAMLDFGLHDHDIYSAFWSILLMLVVSRFITFMAIYSKVRAST